MEHHRLKLIWTTNKAGVYFVLFTGLVQIWILYSQPDSTTNKFMDCCRSKLESLWYFVWVGIFNKNTFVIRTIGTTVWVLLWYTLVNSFFFICDVTGRPDFIHRYKIQEPRKSVSRDKIVECLRVNFVNLVVVHSVINILMYPVLEWRGALHTGELPTFGEAVIRLVAFRLVEEVANYYSHRLLHSPALYKYHKRHHEWTAPIGITTVYCGPVEHVLNNLAPVMLGPLLFGSHILLTWAWVSYLLLAAIMEHIGYHLPFCYSNEGHDFHHKTFTSWYGTLAFLDVLHGTDRPFSDSVQGKRHFISCSLTPVKDIVSDSKGE